MESFFLVNEPQKNYITFESFMNDQIAEYLLLKAKGFSPSDPRDIAFMLPLSNLWMKKYNKGQGEDEVKAYYLKLNQSQGDAPAERPQEVKGDLGDHSDPPP